MTFPDFNPTDAESPWSVQTEADECGHWRRVTWALSRQGLQEALLDSPSQASKRSLPAWPSAASSVLLLTDVTTLDALLVAMALFARPDPTAVGALQIEARLTSERGLGGPLLARLDWIGHTLSNVVDEAGTAVFAGMPIDSLIDRDSGRARSGLRITLERPAPPPA